MSDENQPDHFKRGSDNIYGGTRQLTKGLAQTSLWIGNWLNGHPILKFAVLAPVSTILGAVVIGILTSAHTYFFGAVGVISRDLKVQVFPAPVGFSLWILSITFAFFALLAYFRFVTLRQRITDLERMVDDANKSN